MVQGLLDSPCLFNEQKNNNLKSITDDFNVRREMNAFQANKHKHIATTKLGDLNIFHSRFVITVRHIAAKATRAVTECCDIAIWITIVTAHLAHNTSSLISSHSKLLLFQSICFPHSVYLGDSVPCVNFDCKIYNFAKLSFKYVINKSAPLQILLFTKYGS